MTNDFSNASNRVITFSVVRQPKLGRLALRRPDNSTSDVSAFTQDMVSDCLDVMATPLGAVDPYGRCTA